MFKQNQNCKSPVFRFLRFQIASCWLKPSRTSIRQSHKKLLKELLEKYDLVDYNSNVLSPQEDLLVEPRVTRAKAKAIDTELLVEENEEEDSLYPDYYDDKPYFENPNPKVVAFNDNVQTRYINS